MVFLPSLDTKSFRDLAKSVRNVLADAWRDNRGQFAVLLIIAGAVAVLPYAISGGLALLVNQLVHSHESYLMPLVIAISVVCVSILASEQTQAFMQYFQHMARLRRKQYYDLRFNEGVSALDVATHEDPTFRDLFQVVSERGGPFIVANFFDSLMASAGGLLSALTAASIVLVMDWRLFLLIFVASIHRFYTEAKYGERIFSVYGTESSERRQYIETVRHMENARGIKHLQLFQAREFFLKRQKEMLDRFSDKQREVEIKRFRMSIIGRTLIFLAVGISIVVLVCRFRTGTIQIGSFTFLFAAIIGLQNAVAGFFTQLASQLSDSRYVASFYDILERERTIKSPVNGIKVCDGKALRIEFRNVSFAYPRKPDVMVLRNFSLTIEPGERLAIVGVNTAGKSTLTKLLCRHYDPTEGSILINGVDLREVDLESWYSCLGMLTQDFQTYHLPVRELIALGRVGPIDQDKVVTAAKRAHVDEIIRAWSDGYRHQIGSEFAGGTDPSGGAEQMLALAQVLYRDAPVTILDEPTAHVDAEAEEDIFIQLEESAGLSQTFIFIAHRFSTVRKANRICVIDKGTVAELGNHEELLELNGTYAKLFRLQAAGYQ